MRQAWPRGAKLQILGVLAVLWGLAIDASAQGADRGPAPATRQERHPIVAGFERFYQAADSDRTAGGELLLGELGCTACHRPDHARKGRLIPKRAPILDEASTRLRPAWVEKFLTDPAGTKPGTTMPDALAGFSGQERAQRARWLVHFLFSKGTSTDQASFDPAAATRGQTLFHQIGCVGCHAPERANAPVLATSVPLGDVAAKYTPASLARFLRDPFQVRPSGRMPALNLEDKEASDLAHFFFRDQTQVPRVRYRYFEGGWQSLPDFSSLEPLAEGLASDLGTGVARRREQMGLRYEGFLRIEREGEYTFHLASDDGSRLVIDDRVIVDNDGVHGTEEKQGKTTLVQGIHPIRLDYFNASGPSELIVEFEGPGVPRRSLAAAIAPAKEEAGLPKKNAAEPPFVFDAELAEKGRAVFASQGCAACHQYGEGKGSIASTLAAKPVRDLDPSRGCLAGQPGGPGGMAPNFHLSERQRQALHAALTQANAPAVARSPAQEIAAVMTSFNCYACHVRDRVGGVEEARDPWFTTTMPEMGDEGRIPPALDGAGDKLTENWLGRIFSQGTDDRPYMHTRMPKFGGGNVGHLAKLLAAADAVPAVPPPTIDLPLHRIKSDGRFLVGEKGFSCYKCHPFANHKAPGIQATNMTLMTQRLRADWFQRYLRDPAAYRPGTRMPASWPMRGKSLIYGVLEGDSEKQIRAIWDYLADGSGARVPMGLIPEPIELKPEREPIVYRNFIEGAGPRAIGVGYPEKANLAYDANHCSIAVVWHGPFIDASRHWTGRGTGFQPPLGDNVLRLAVGVPLAVLADASSPWPSGTAGERGYRFLGYRLAGDGRPTFRFEFGSIQVEDFPAPLVADLEPESGRPKNPARRNDPGFCRTLTLHLPDADEGEITPANKNAPRPKGPVWFRAAAGAKIESQGDGWFLIEGAWRTKPAGGGDAPPLLRHEAGRDELLIPVIWRDNGTATVGHLVRW